MIAAPRGALRRVTIVASARNWSSGKLPNSGTDFNTVLETAVPAPDIPPPMTALGRLRREVGGDGDDVVLFELRHHVLHQQREGSGAKAVLDVVELARGVVGRTPGDAGDYAHALQVGTVAAHAGERLARAAVFYQGPPTRQAADGHVADEARVRVAPG